MTKGLAGEGQELPSEKITHPLELQTTIQPCPDRKMDVWGVNEGSAGFTIRDMVPDLAPTENAAKQRRWKVRAWFPAVGKDGRYTRYVHYSLHADGIKTLTPNPKGVWARRAAKAGLDERRQILATIEQKERGIWDAIEAAKVENTFAFMHGAPFYIHAEHFEVPLPKSLDDYIFTGGREIKGNGQYHLIEYRRTIGGHPIKFQIHPFVPKVMIYCTTGRRPHRVETREDWSRYNRWIGGIWQELCNIMALNYSNLNSKGEPEDVPEPDRWNVTHYHLNIDLPVPDGILLTTPINVQFRYLDNYFQFYTKALGDRTVQRVELWNNKSTPLPEMMHEAFTIAGHEKRLTRHDDDVLELGAHQREQDAKIEDLTKQVAELKGIVATLQQGGRMS